MPYSDFLTVNNNRNHKFRLSRLRSVDKRLNDKIISEVSPNSNNNLRTVYKNLSLNELNNKCLKVLFYYLRSEDILATFKLLSKSPTLINMLIDTGLMAVHIAVEINSRKMTKLHLSMGSDPNLKDCLGRTPLIIAYSKIQIPIIKVF